MTYGIDVQNTNYAIVISLGNENAAQLKFWHIV